MRTADTCPSRHHRMEVRDPDATVGLARRSVRFQFRLKLRELLRAKKVVGALHEVLEASCRSMETVVPSCFTTFKTLPSPTAAGDGHAMPSAHRNVVAVALRGHRFALATRSSTNLPSPSAVGEGPGMREHRPAHAPPAGRTQHSVPSTQHSALRLSTQHSALVRCPHKEHTCHIRCGAPPLSPAWG